MYSAAQTLGQTQANGFLIQIDKQLRKKMNDMAENETNRISGGAGENNDVISNLEALSKKYGLSFDASAYKSPTDGSQYSLAQAKNSEKTYTPPKNNMPAGVPRVTFDPDTAIGSVRLVYTNGADAPSGPEGRRIIYSEPETETIAEKRMRNRAAQRSVKGSAGFGSQPYVRHVASSDTAMLRDDADKFTREYEEKKLNNETNKETEHTSVPRTSARLVATNTDAKKTETASFQHYEPTAGEKIGRFFKSFIPWKGDGAKEVARKLIMDLSAVLVVLCFVYFVDNYIQHQDKLEKNKEIVEMQTDAPTDNLEARWAEIKARYPDVNFPEGMNIKYAELYAKNQDLVGWLKIDGTNIDTPIVQSALTEDGENDEFYLKRNFYKKDDKYGNPFLDSYNTGSELDTNNVIYGHNMTDGLSFAQLEKYYTPDGFRESPVIRYSTIYKDYYFKVYAVIITNGYHSGDNNYLFDYTITRFTGEENFSTFIEAIDERKLYDTGVDINTRDKIITLSTCSYEIKQNQMGRLAVIGRLVRDGESTAVDTSKVTENPNPRYPQIWYDEHGLQNPYKDAFQWIPE